MMKEQRLLAAVAILSPIVVKSSETRTPSPACKPSTLHSYGFSKSEQQLVFLTKVFILDGTTSLVDRSRMFLHPGYTSQLCEMGSCKAADLGVVHALQVYLLLCISFFLFIFIC